MHKYCTSYTETLDNIYSTKKHLATFPGEGKCPLAHACGRPWLGYKYAYSNPSSKQYIHQKIRLWPGLGRKPISGIFRAQGTWLVAASIVVFLLKRNQKIEANVAY